MLVFKQGQSQAALHLDAPEETDRQRKDVLVEQVIIALEVINVLQVYHAYQTPAKFLLAHHSHILHGVLAQTDSKHAPSQAALHWDALEEVHS